MGAQDRARGRNFQAVASAFGFGRLAAGGIVQVCPNCWWRSL
jgi:hypothetical protein